MKASGGESTSRSIPAKLPDGIAMSDGLVLFYFTPDWRTRQVEMDVPSLSGKLALMPLPAWTPEPSRRA